MTMMTTHPMMSRAMQNEDWDDLSLHQHQKVVGTAAVAVLTPSREEFLLHAFNMAEPEEAAAGCSLDDYLHNYPTVPDFILSIPSREGKQELLPSDNEQKNGEESCDESILSDITEMTYRAELMKQVSSEKSYSFFNVRTYVVQPLTSFYRTLRRH